MLSLPKKNYVVVKLKIVTQKKKKKKITENYFLKDKYDLMKRTSHKPNK